MEAVVPLRPIDLAGAHAALGIVVGLLAATRPRRPPPRAAHRAAYAGACAWSVIAAREPSARRPLAPALAALAALPRTRPGTRPHATTAVLATIALLRAGRTIRGGGSRLGRGDAGSVRKRKETPLAEGL